MPISLLLYAQRDIDLSVVGRLASAGNHSDRKCPVPEPSLRQCRETDVEPIALAFAVLPRLGEVSRQAGHLDSERVHYDLR